MDDPHYNLQSDDSSHNEQLNSALEFLKNGETDLSFISQDGQKIETHKSLVCLYSETVSNYLSGIPCCKDASISLPVSSLAINNLLQVLQTGGFNTDTIEHEELSDVTEAAKILGIVLQNIDFVLDNEETNLDEAGIKGDPGKEKVGKNKAKVKSNMRKRNVKVKKEPVADEFNESNEVDNDETNLDEAYNDVIKTEPGMNIDGSKKKLDKIKLKAKVKAKMKKKVMKAKTEPVTEEVNAEQLLQEDDVVLKSSSFKKVSAGTHKCTRCEKMFASSSILNRHIMTHTGEKPFACGQCGKCFSRKDKMKTHEKTHGGQDVDKIHEKNQGGKTIKDNKEEDYSCESCDMIGMTKKELKKHVKTVHTEGQPLYKCNICTKSFKTEWYVKTHEKSHTVA